jgi:hypothetical protein
MADNEFLLLSIGTVPVDSAHQGLAAKDIGLKDGMHVVVVTSTSLTLSDAYHGWIIDFASGSAVTVTVPPDLRPDFVCGISQGGAGQVTVAAGSGVAVNEADSQLATEKQYVLLTLAAFARNSYRLFGRTA